MATQPIPRPVDSGFHPWFALRVRSKWEAAVASHLDGRGYQWFLPTYECRRNWSDRVRKFHAPLFPGYLFCRFDSQNRLPILTTPGLIQIVGVGKTPVPVEEAEIAAIERIVRSGLPSEPWPFLRVGEQVRIERGPLCGMEGILVRLRGRHRVVVSVALLQRSVSVELDDGWVSRVPVSPSYLSNPDTFGALSPSVANSF